MTFVLAQRCLGGLGVDVSEASILKLNLRTLVGFLYCLTLKVTSLVLQETLSIVPRGCPEAQEIIPHHPSLSVGEDRRGREENTTE